MVPKDKRKMFVMAELEHCKATTLVRPASRVHCILSTSILFHRFSLPFHTHGPPQTNADEMPHTLVAPGALNEECGLLQSSF